MNTVHIGHVDLGRVPRVVGTMTSRASLPGLLLVEPAALPQRAGVEGAAYR